MKTVLEKEEERSENYRLDESTESGERLAVISPENVSKAFAMIADSPQYKKAMRIEEEDCGSSAFLFNKWKNERESGKNIGCSDLLNLLERLNNENSTRADGDGDLEQMKKNIYSEGLNSIIEMLEGSKYCVIEVITKCCKKTPFSLATKFCHYACAFLLKDENRDNFPIFDKTMRKNLGKYSDEWEKAKLEGTHRRLRNIESYSDLKPEQLTEIYRKYVDAVNGLAEKHRVSKTGVEQLIWYFHNGE